MVNSLSSLAAGESASRTSNQTSRLASLLAASASGNRITRAMDDIASLSVGTGLSSELSGLRSAALNVNQAGSFLDVADGGIRQIDLMLERLKRVATQANSGALDDNTRSKLNQEFQELISEIDRVASETNFNGVKLIDGSLSSQTLRTDAEALEAGDVTVSGTVGDSLVSAAQEQAAAVQISFASAADINAGDTISISDGAGGTMDFTFVAGAPAAADEIEIGPDLERTLENAAAAINAYVGANDEGVSQINASIDGDALVFESQKAGDVLGADDTTVITVSTTAAGTQSNAAFDNGSTAGVDVRAVVNKDFAGKVSGFDAAFVGNDRVSLSIQVGEETYRASNVNTNDTADQTVTFTSASGDSFDVTLAGGQGQEVRNGDDADAFGRRLDAAFESLTFNQNREVTNFTAAGDLAGASLEVSGAVFSDRAISTVEVKNDKLEVVLNGKVFRSKSLGESVGATERIVLQAEDGTETITFTNGDTRFDISTAQGANQFAQAIGRAAGTGEQIGAGFQVSSSADGSLRIGVGDFSAKGLGLEGIDLLSADSAATAFAAVGAAIDTLISQRADVGAFQRALGFAGNNIEIAIQNQEAARSVLLDTDIAASSMDISLLEAALDASVNTLAQTNRLQANLLKLVQ